MIIGVCGFKGSGKDTVADIITGYGYTKTSMASILKDVVSSLFGWDRKMLEGDTTESRSWREESDPFWSRLSGIGIFKDDDHVSPRIALQRIGTDLIRKYIHPDFFLMRLSNLSDVVISDIRFGNEMEYCDIVINVIRKEYSQKELDMMHVSETEHIRYPHTYTIYNDGTLSDLEDKVKDIMIDIRSNQ